MLNKYAGYDGRTTNKHHTCCKKNGLLAWSCRIVSKGAVGWDNGFEKWFFCDYCCCVCACRLVFGIQPWCGMYYGQLWMHYKIGKFQTLVGRTKSCYSPTVNLQRCLENFTVIGVYTMVISQNHSSALFLKKTLWELCAATTRGPPQWIHVSGSKALLTRGMCSALFSFTSSAFNHLPLPVHGHCCLLSAF